MKKPLSLGKNQTHQNKYF